MGLGGEINSIMLQLDALFDQYEYLFSKVLQSSYRTSGAADALAGAANSQTTFHKAIKLYSRNTWFMLN